MSIYLLSFDEYSKLIEKIVRNHVSVRPSPRDCRCLLNAAEVVHNGYRLCRARTLAKYRNFTEYPGFQTPGALRIQASHCFDMEDAVPALSP